MLKHDNIARLDARHQSFSYQIQAVEAVKSLPYAALFHEQGLGKTKIAIDLALEWFRTTQIDCVLIVTKRGLVTNWTDEAAAHSYFSPRVLDQNHASNFYALNSDSRFLLTHYEVIKTEERRLQLFLKTRRVAVILDESHKIKNPESAISQALHRLSSGFIRRVIMTGTPVANRPFDLWSQIFFLDSGKSLGTDFESFRDKLDLSNDLWAHDAKRERFENELAAIFAKIKAFTVRETKGSAGIDLPKKRIENIAVEQEPEQQRLYDQIRYKMRAEVVRDNQIVEDDADEILKRLLRLVQVASNPHLVDRSYVKVPGKLPRLLQLVERAVSEGSKLIVWTNFVENCEWLKSELRDYGAVAVHGSVSSEDRDTALSRFKKAPDCKILVATPGSAKEGLTLTVANHAIFYDRSFSLDDYLQAQDRIHRISQSQTCYVWNLIAADSVDEWVDSLLAAKRLAAQLALSDVSPDEYRESATYDFGRIIQEILGGKDQ